MNSRILSMGPTELEKGNLCRPRPTVLHVPLWKGFTADPVLPKMTQVPVRPHTRRRYLIPTRSLKTLVRFTVTYISSVLRLCPGRIPEVYALRPPYTPIIWTFLTSARRDPRIPPSLVRARSAKCARRVLGTPFARNFGARPECPASGHPLTLGVRPGLGPLPWSKQAETWPDPRTSRVAGGFYFRRTFGQLKGNSLGVREQSH